MKQSCRAYSNHSKCVYSVLKKIRDDHETCRQTPQNLNSSINSKIITSFGLFCIDASMFVFRQSFTLLHHPNNKIVYFHSNAPKKIANEACNLIPNTSDSELIPFIGERKQKQTEFSNGAQRSIEFRNQFGKICDSANNKMAELQEELNKMQRFSFKFESLANFEENFDRIQKSIWITEAKVQKITSTHDSLMRITRQINERSKRQNEFNEKAIALNGRRLGRLQCNLNRIAKEMLRQKCDIDALKSSPEYDYDQFKNDFEFSLDARLNAVAAKLEQRTNRVEKINLTFYVLILIVLGLQPIKNATVKRFF